MERFGRDTPSELYDPATDTIIPITGKLPFHGKVDNLAIRLYDDTVVIPTGGNANIQVLPDTSVYRPDQDDFVMAGSVQFPRTTGYGTAALLTDGRIVTGGGIGLTAAGSPKFFNNGEIYTPSDVSQAKGLKKVIADLPKSAFKQKDQKEALKNKLDSIIDLLKCDGKQQQAKALLVQCVIPRIDGCAGGNASDDFIIACDDQAEPYAVAQRLNKTFDEITGVLIPPVMTITATPTSGGKPLAVALPQRPPILTARSCPITGISVTARTTSTRMHQTLIPVRAPIPRPVRLSTMTGSLRRGR